MKFDVPVPCFYGNIDFCDAVKKIYESGFDAIETYDWHNLDFDSVKSVCKEYGIDFVSICTSYFNMTDPSCRIRWIDGLKESCAAAKKLGVNKLITQVGNDTGAERSFQHQSIVDALNEGKSILEYYGVTVMIEPLNVLVDHKGYYLSKSDEAFQIINEVNSDFVKVVYDIYHQQISEGNIIPTIRDNIDSIAHFHCAGHPGRHDLQFGENDYKVIFKAINDLGYSGCCGLEYSPVGDSDSSLFQFKKIYCG